MNGQFHISSTFSSGKNRGTHLTGALWKPKSVWEFWKGQQGWYISFTSVCQPLWDRGPL